MVNQAERAAPTGPTGEWSRLPLALMKTRAGKSPVGSRPLLLLHFAGPLVPCASFLFAVLSPDVPSRGVDGVTAVGALAVCRHARSR